MQQAHDTQRNQIVSSVFDYLLSTIHYLSKKMAYFRKRLSPIKPGEPIDYKDVDLLRKFVTERGKILPRRITGLTSKQQRDMTLSIKRSRQIALMPFINVEG